MSDDFGDHDREALATRLALEYRRGDIQRVNDVLDGPFGQVAMYALLEQYNTMWTTICRVAGMDPDAAMADRLAASAVEAAAGRRPA